MYRRLALLAFGAALVVSGCTPVETSRAVMASPPAVEPAGKPPPDPPEELETLLRGDKELATFLDDAERRRLQVLVAIPDEDTGLRRLGFRVDAEYFYPASAVKLCAAFGAVEKLDEIRSSRMSRTASLDTRMRFVDGEGRSRRVLTTTLRTELEKSLVLSDNEAHNRVFDFVGRAELAMRLSRAGLRSARIAQHLGREVDDGPAPVIDMVMPGRRSVPIAQRTDFELPPAPSQLLVGVSHVDATGRVVAGPMDFAAKNIISLRELQYLLIAIARPDLADRGKPLLPNNDDRKKLLEILGMLPSELGPKSRRPSQGVDALYKPMHLSIVNALPNERIRVHGKGGRALGFSVESVYAVNESTKRSLFITATIYANDNETLNDDRYEYETVASPFMTRLGHVLARAYLSAPNTAE
jgi:hypothetical protein